MRENVFSIVFGIVCAGAIIWITKQGLSFTTATKTARDVVLVLEVSAVSLLAAPIVIHEWLKIIAIFQSMLRGQVPGHLERDWRAFAYVVATITCSGIIYLLLLKLGKALEII